MVKGGAARRRTLRPERTLSRPPVRRTDLLWLARRITGRDRNLLEDLYEHRVLTTHQIQRLYFDSSTVTRRRMLLLYRAGLVNRFQPWAHGSAPFHYVLDDLGAHIVAAERGVELRDLGFRRDTLLRLPYSTQFAHLVAINEFFTILAGACRQDGTYQLSDWWSETRCQQRFGPIIIPDGYATIDNQQTQLSFLLELDRDTESLHRLANKLAGYRRIAALPESPDALLFCFPTPQREAAARKRLYLLPLTIATTTWDRAQVDPLGPIWLPLAAATRRPLIELLTHVQAGGAGGAL